MKCPLLIDREFDEEGDLMRVQSECLTDNCAWYATWSTAKLPMVSGCAITLIASGMALLNGAMPKEYQFRERG